MCTHLTSSRAILIATLAMLVGGYSTAQQEGWTEFPQHPLTKKIYVSSSSGNDLLNGSNSFLPVRTIERAKELVRDNMPDWILLKRGDVWNEPLGDWKFSGLSAAAPMIIGNYGTGERPIIRPGPTFGFRIFNPLIQHLALVGIHFQADPSPTATRKAGISLLGPANDILFEDCVVEEFGTNVTMQAVAGPLTNIRFRRSMVLGAYLLSGISNGMFLSGVDGLLIEECFFDHNGWKAGVAPKSIFNRNTYIQYNCTDVIFRRNISIRSSASAVSMRGGGIVEDNLIVSSPIGVGFGSSLPDGVPGGIGGAITGNVILNCNDIEDIPHGWGMWISNVGFDDTLVVANNIIAHEQSIADGRGIQFAASDEPIRNATIENNIIYHAGQGIRISGDTLSNNVFRNNVIRILENATYAIDFINNDQIHPSQMVFSGNKYFAQGTDWFHLLYTPPGGSIQQEWYTIDEWPSVSGEADATDVLPSYFDPNRSVESYHQLIGGAPSLAAYAAEVKKQGFGNWRTEYTAAPVIAYIQAGFAGAAPTINGGGWAEIGSPVQFSVEGAEGGATFQWRKNGAIIPGATNPTYVIAPALATDAGNYSVTVMQTAGTVTVGPVQLIMVAELPASRDLGTMLLVLSLIAMGGLAIYRRCCVHPA